MGARISLEFWDYDWRIIWFWICFCISIDFRVYFILVKLQLEQLTLFFSVTLRILVLTYRDSRLCIEMLNITTFKIKIMKILFTLIMNCTFVFVFCPGLQVWDGKGFSECFEDIYPYCFWDFLVFSFCTDIYIFSPSMDWFSLIAPTFLGFAVNIVTIVMTVVLGFNQKIGRGVQRSDAQVVAELVILKAFENALENHHKETCKIFIIWPLFFYSQTSSYLQAFDCYPVVILCMVFRIAHRLSIHCQALLKLSGSCRKMSLYPYKWFLYCRMYLR